MPPVATPAAATSRIVSDLVCGFCGLGCDDLEVTVQGRAVHPRVACPQAAALLQRTDGPPPLPRVAGRETSLEEAATAAAALLETRRSTVFSGLGADVDGLRGVFDLAMRFGASFDHAASSGLFRNLDTLQRRGWIATTLAEVRNRCDLLVLVGADPTPDFARFFERALPPAFGEAADGDEVPLFTNRAHPRRVVFLGDLAGPAARAALAGHDVSHLPVPAALLADAMAGLNAFVDGRSVKTLGGAFDGALGAALAELAGALKAACYSVLTWNAGALDPGEGERIVGHAAAIVAKLNETTRAAVFPLGGRDNLIGAHQMALWRFGYPLRTRVAQGEASHAPNLYATSRAVRDADLLVHVSAFRPDPPPVFSSGPVIALAHPHTEFAREPDVFIPVGTPGIDHAGQVFRMDSVVCLPLVKLREAGLASVAEAAAAILQSGRRP
ncbi:formylmethanofuran dehydrogenase [Roseixanthobacter glucoisosaccharinicivorans]|uniref:formylmethanofuran dehydrogenase n=1 Tax=Roseixanthobacter glucoisosaccharinicivorans TaxID=3119923 RepID=UPI0037277834